MALTGTFSFIGYGNMGSAILEGLIEAGLLDAKQAVVFDLSPERQKAAQSIGAAPAMTPAEAARRGDVLMLAVKPQQMAEVCAELRPELQRSVPVISIAAGIAISKLRGWLGESVRVIRVMPNTPALVAAGAAGIALAPNCTPGDAALARAIFEAVGIAELVPEELIDAVTALSGSGPAYFFAMVEHLIAAAQAEGLSAEIATRLAAQTLFGAGKLLQATGEPAGVLRARVTSPGGTTEAALKQFGALDFEGTVRKAVHAAVVRAKELGA